MSDKEKNIIYTARDIEQYLAGNLSPLQMHAMEKAALDDPFLAEAMEGYTNQKPTGGKQRLLLSLLVVVPHLQYYSITIKKKTQIKYKLPRQKLQ